jgi:hypothetical protein
VTARSLLVLTAWLFASGTLPHATSQSSLQWVVEERAIRGTVQLAVQDAAGVAMPITDYVLRRVELSADDRPCRLAVASSRVVRDQWVVQLEASCAAAFATLTVRDDLLFEHDAAHRSFVRVEVDGQSLGGVLHADAREFRFTREHGRLRTIAQYVREGVWHILSGYDHLLFLFTLLLPAALHARAGSIRPAFIEVARIVTAFTLAHSLTLALSALHVVDLPARFVEPAIAASIVVAALSNLRSGTRVGAALAFGFGLLHGFGFAGVLAELGLPGRAAFGALIGFNIGVELGQLAVVGLVYPALIALRHRAFYDRYLLRIGSCAIIAIASFWFFERTRELPAAEHIGQEERSADSALARADLQAAEQHYLQALELCSVGDANCAARLCRQLALTARMRADPTEAARWLRRALEYQLRQPTTRALQRDRLELAALYCETEQLAAARRQYALVAAHSTDPVERGKAFANEAAVARRQGAASEARALYERALEAFERAPAPTPAARVRALLAQGEPF